MVLVLMLVLRVYVSVVASIGGGAERGAVIGTASVAMPGGNPGQAADVAVVIRAGVATRADGTAVAGAVAGGVGKSAAKRRGRCAATNEATPAAAATFASRSELLGKTTHSMSMVRQLLVVVMVGGNKDARAATAGVRVDACASSLCILPRGQCLHQNPEARTSRGEVRTKQEEIADVRAGITERRVEYRALLT